MCEQKVEKNVEDTALLCMYSSLPSFSDQTFLDLLVKKSRLHVQSEVPRPKLKSLTSDL